MNFRHRLETSLTDYLRASTAIATVAGQSAASRPDAVVIVFCEGTRAESVGQARHGNFDADVRIIVRTNANDKTAADHADTVEVVTRAMRDLPPIKAACQLNMVHLYDAKLESSDEGVDGDRFMTTVTFSAPCVDLQF